MRFSKTNLLVMSDKVCFNQHPLNIYFETTAFWLGFSLKGAIISARHRFKEFQTYFCGDFSSQNRNRCYNAFKQQLVRICLPQVHSRFVQILSKQVPWLGQDARAVVWPQIYRQIYRHFLTNHLLGSGRYFQRKHKHNFSCNHYSLYHTR